MNHFRDIPIKQKLTVTILVTVAVSLLLSGAGVVAADSFLFRSYLNRDLSALANILADNSNASIAFDDPQSANEVLASLRSRTHVVSACVRGANEVTLASYARPGAPTGCPSPGPEAGIRSTPEGLVVSQPIMLQSRSIGTVVLLYDLDEVGQRVRVFGTTVLIVLLISSVFAFWVSAGLRALVAAPILELAQAVTAVSKTKNYGIRARRLSGDETGVLTDAINEMLAGIQTRDTDLRKALVGRENALASAENAREFLATTLASIGDAVISTDTEGRVVFANPVAQALLGWPEAEIVGKHLDEVFRIVNELTREKVESPVAKVLREGTIVGMANHTLLMARSGAEIPIDDSGAPIRDSTGATRGTVLVFRDVTQSRRAEQTTRLLASIVESSDDAIVGHDLDCIFTTWNKGAEKTFGYSSDEAIGRSTLLIADSESGDEMPGVLERIKRGERIDQYQAVRRTKNGQPIHVSVTVSPLLDELGRVVGASKIARDITEQVMASERLAQLNAALRRSNEDLERFAFVASHDLQEPLRMISVYSQLLIRACAGKVDGDTGMFVDYITGGTRRMRELLADLLAYAEIGANREDPVSTIDLNVVLEKVKENLRASIDDSGARVSSVPLPFLKADEVHFIPLFQNLIENAIKYRGADAPQIQIRVEESAHHVQFSVADNGIGIEPEYQEKIFAPFKRLHGPNIPGTGIGLAICLRVIERYGGRIWVESEAGRGATFHFTLPGKILPGKDKS
ncbi:MAG: PAS domain S-box protein [Bryobacteraceae bacterium]